MRPSTLARGLLLSVAAAPLCFVAPAHAQDGFLFEHPRVTLSVRGGHHMAAAGSDIYDFFTEQLTLERSDFSGFAFFGSLGVYLSPHFEVAGGIGMVASDASSESRTHFSDPPILQQTSLKRTPVTATLKYYPLARGRTIGSNAWIPARVTPWIGVGGGALRYDLEQSGEFVDYNTCDAHNVCDIFASEFTSDGWTSEVHVSGGADYWLTTRLGLSAEARYQWASAPLSSSFIDFEDIDLRGFQGTVGLSVRF